MSDHLPDTPLVALTYCPDCQPERDPFVEVLDVFWCDAHRPSTAGEVDHVVNSSAYLSGSSEAGGDDNKAYCAFFHRGRIADGGVTD